MKNTIVFKIEIGNVRDYAEFGNFISKRENHKILSQKELKNVTYCYYLKNDINNNKEWSEEICKNKINFKKVKEPDKIKNITGNYEIIYSAIINDQSDIVELQNIFLLKKYYQNLKILVICETGDISFYFKVSQYLYSVMTMEPQFLNSFYFIEEGSSRRCQTNNLEFSRKFVPLQIVDENNIRRLFKKCKDVLTKEDVQNIFSKEKSEKLIQESDILEGAKKLLHELQKKLKLENIDIDYIYKIIGEMEIFSFILFCYAINIDGEQFLNWNVIERYILQMRQYANAIKQLCENIIFHSNSKFGCISVRIHDAESNYFKSTYSVCEDELNETYMEILISDFNAENISGNISENFVKGLTDGEIKSKFFNLKPISFFDQNINEESNKVWKQFYLYPQNIGKHFGLKIFQSIVNEYKGYFIAESHSTYYSKEGETYYSFDKGEILGICLPGTRYSIALPIKTIRHMMIEQDQSLDSGINMGKYIDKIFNYTAHEIPLEWEDGNYDTQEKKNEIITENAQDFIKVLKENKYDIVYISMDNIVDEIGELFVKSLIIALYNNKRDIRIVLFDCSEALRKTLFDTIKVFMCNTDMEGMFYDTNYQIVIYTKNYEELVIIPKSIKDTNDVNAYIEHMKCVTLSEWYVQPEKWSYNIDAGSEIYIPYDIIGNVTINGAGRTLFEHYTYSILNENIQSNVFGCKLHSTHMRLGSTIHIDRFYEADILFDNKLFVSRFALLLVKEMKKDIKDVESLTLYGYGTYSETVLVQAIEMIQQLYPDKKDIDYIILEREEERRGFRHKDRIRYNRPFMSKEERIDYFRNRKVAVIVLINSTLKTHVRLISLFKEENAIAQDDEDWILKNYAVLLVGETENDYWELQNKNIKVKKENILPTPQYFIQTNAKYYEPLNCELCFPKKSVAEVPLIEVNAASTIPNQAFGIIKEAAVNTIPFKYKEIEDEENEISKLKECLVYGHICRNENHFLFYFKTEYLWIKERRQISKSLFEWKNKWEKRLAHQYNIIVAPMHFSNAGFVELVNDQVFNGNAILMRLDFDKEYRSNAYAKFSYLRNYIEQLLTLREDGIVRVHYVDDSIISGRTFHRAKSIIKSVLNVDKYRNSKLEIRIFDKIFVLIDRNSKDSRMQYIINWNHSNLDQLSDLEEYYYSFINVNISSLRNYGDSCVYCNLEKEAELLYITSSTAQISNYWKQYMNKLRLCTVEDFVDERNKLSEDKKEKYKNRSFRRLFCTHMAQKILSRDGQKNSTESVMYIVLYLLNEDFDNRSKINSKNLIECGNFSDDEKVNVPFEYFLSYLKCISRPFLVFKKEIKEAIFDILLVIIDAVIKESSIENVIKGVGKEKKYLSDRKIKKEFKRLNDNIINSSNITFENKRDLIRLIMKQLTELKSNYIIRLENMDAIFAFMKNEKDEKEFQNYYMSLIKRLVGSSSDTNKSAWLDDKILNSENKLSNVPLDFKVLIILENTKAFRDGIEKLYDKVEVSGEFRQYTENRINKVISEYNAARGRKMIDDFELSNKVELKQYRNLSSKTPEEFEVIKKKIIRLIKQLPELPNVAWKALADSLSEQTDNWSVILNRVSVMLDIERAEIAKKVDETKKEYSQLINDEINVYQFNSFNSILQKCGCLDDEDIKDKGLNLISACLSTLLICRNIKDETEEKPLLEKVWELAMLFNIILDTDRVQFIIEKKRDTYLDEWKQDIKGVYNREIIDEFNQKNEDNINSMDIQDRRQYMVIGENSGNSAYPPEVDENTQSLLNLFNNDEKVNNTGYYYDKGHGIVIWKIENNHRTVWITVSSTNWMKENMELYISYTMRRIMVFYQELRERIFNAENDDYLNEKHQDTKKLNLYYSNKIYSHTKDKIENNIYKHAVAAFETEEKKYDECDNSYILNLLADMNVSRCYRHSLQKNFYEEKFNFNEPVRWGSFTLLKNDRQYIYKEENGEKIFVKLKVTDIDENEEVLCKTSPDGIKEFMMLIYSVILNAAEDRRGKREKNDVQEQDKYVIVSLKKENGDLVITNKMAEDAKTIDVKELQKDLNRVPEFEENGISMWSVNRYIKKCLNIYIMDKIEKMKEKLKNDNLTQDDIIKIRDKINKMLGEEYDVRFSKEIIEKENYFAVKLPIFMEAYRWNI